MVKDINGQRLREGDKVVIPATVRALAGSNGRDLLLVTEESEERLQSLIRLRGDQVVQANVPTKLEFIVPELRDGVNVTVRSGTKWAGAPIGYGVELVDVGKGEGFGTAQVVGKAVLPFHMIPQELLDLEHDSSCRNMKGLLKAMQRAYPGFKPSEVVTVLLFERN
jgi:hypothetical protein